MATYLVYPAILQGHEATEENALSYAQHVCFEFDAVEQNIGHARHVETVGLVGVYYDYAADYYFFTAEEDTEQEELTTAIKEAATVAIKEHLNAAFKAWKQKHNIQTELNANDLLRHYEGEVVHPEKRFVFEMPNNCDCFLRSFSVAYGEATK